MPLFLTIAAPKFSLIFSHSYSELPASSAILISHDNDHVIFTFVLEIWKRDLAGSVKHNIKLVWPYGIMYIHP